MVVLALVVLAGAVALSQQGMPGSLTVTSESNPWTNLKLNNDPDAFQFAIVSDRTGAQRKGVQPRRGSPQSLATRICYFGR
jgi:hypothetical protein